MMNKEKARREEAKAALEKYKEIESREIFRRQLDTHDIYRGVARLEETIERLEKRNKELSEALNAPTDEKLADAYDEIKSLEDKLGELRRKSLYVLTDKEKEDAHKFWEEHRKVCPRKGRVMHWILTGTGIGT